MRKSLEVLSFMYCIRFTWTTYTDVGETLDTSGLTDETALRVFGEITVFCSIFSFASRFVYFANSNFSFRVIQLPHTFDFFESVMRYFSYCSMLKIKSGMAFVSRRSFAYQEKIKRM